MSRHDIVIAGGGPTGLMLACELALCGVRPRVLEALPRPTGLSKALGFSGRAVDILDFRGILDRFRAASPDLGDIRRLAHFGGIPLDVGRAPGLALRFIPVLQADTEAVLAARAAELGIEIERGSEVVGLHQHDDGVTVTVAVGGATRELEAGYLIGCDGGHSAVRKLAGIAFPGIEPTLLLRLADVKLPAVPPGAQLPFGTIRLDADYVRVTTMEPYPEGFDRDVPMTLDELRDSVRRVHGIDLVMAEPRWLSRFTDASRQAEHYRVRRVFVAGDAAHIHLPAGGPGLSTGLNDAANLGWKLAAAVRGWAPAGLLDSYHAERHPVGLRVLMHTRVQAALLRGGPHRPALREFFTEILQDEATIRRVANLLAGNVRYALGPPDADPRVGAWAPDLPLVTESGPSRLAALMHRARGVLLDLRGDPRDPALAQLAAGWADRVDLICAHPGEAAAGVDVLLVRPDGYVAWAAATGGDRPLDPSGVRAALETWFGAPA